MEEHDTFTERLLIKDEWKTKSDQYRLVDLGAGPMKLQKRSNGEWVEESLCYQWGVVVSRIEQLAYKGDPA